MKNTERRHLLRVFQSHERGMQTNTEPEHRKNASSDN